MNRLNIGLGLGLGVSSFIYFTSIFSFTSIIYDDEKCSKQYLGLKLCKEANGKYARCDDAKYDLSACFIKNLKT
ncbi:hypothetical protein SteCoe_35941 [Stentor coeruleus]|uniref:Uncharacterized protein n=1 Tax=Stentor coeruleus TaxID=5963 RepID=A0A1R2ARF4_9CILI|nr:hypothetical protein SteCoe_35941 [Stentor coeruleus]